MEDDRSDARERRRERPGAGGGKGLGAILDVRRVAEFESSFDRHAVVTTETSRLFSSISAGRGAPTVGSAA